VRDHHRQLSILPSHSLMVSSTRLNHVTTWHSGYYWLYQHISCNYRTRNSIPCNSSTL